MTINNKKILQVYLFLSSYVPIIICWRIFLNERMHIWANLDYIVFSKHSSQRSLGSALLCPTEPLAISQSRPNSHHTGYILNMLAPESLNWIRFSDSPSLAPHSVIAYQPSISLLFPLIACVMYWSCFFPTSISYLFVFNACTCTLPIVLSNIIFLYIRTD